MSLPNMELAGYLIVPEPSVYMLANLTLWFLLLYVFKMAKVILVYVHSPLFNIQDIDVDVLVCLKFKGDFLYCA